MKNSSSKLQTSIRLLKETDLKAILELQDCVYDSLQNKALLIIASKRFISDHLLGKNGTVYGVFHRNKLIAYSILHFPGDKEDNLGLDINLPKNELNKVAHLEIQMVHPDFRGNGLQTILNKIMIEEARKKNYFHILCTVSPDNVISHRNLEKLGLKVAKTKLKYGNNKRDIMYMKLHCK